MAGILWYHAVPILMCFSISATAFPPSGLDSPRRNTLCRREEEYQEKSFCCLNCPPGTYVKSPCSQPGEMGQCEECEDGTFAEHANEFKQCFKCTRCNADQDTVRPCSHTQDSECQCKAGGFCASEEACEVCRKCSRCKQDQTIVRNCTATSDTECKQATPPSGSVRTIISVVCGLFIFAVVVVVVVLLWKKMHSRGANTRELKAAQHSTEDQSNVENRPLVSVSEQTEDLCESLSSTACNSQHSLTSLAPSAPPAPAPPAYALVPRPTASREDEPFPKLLPVNGEESLRKCFEYFEDVDVDYHKRFFRHLGLSDNVIKGKEVLPYEDRIHDLLNVWVEQRGRDASLNDLLKALLDLNQRRTAETVKESAVGQGHYVCEGH